MEQNRSSSLGDCRDGSGLQFINFDSVKKSMFLFWWNFEFFSRYFVFLFHISLRS